MEDWLLKDMYDTNQEVKKRLACIVHKEYLEQFYELFIWGCDERFPICVKIAQDFGFGQKEIAALREDIEAFKEASIERSEYEEGESYSEEEVLHFRE